MLLCLFFINISCTKIEIITFVQIMSLKVLSNQNTNLIKTLSLFLLGYRRLSCYSTSNWTRPRSRAPRHLISATAWIGIVLVGTCGLNSPLSTGKSAGQLHCPDGKSMTIPVVFAGLYGHFVFCSGLCRRYVLFDYEGRVLVRSKRRQFYCVFLKG